MSTATNLTPSASSAAVSSVTASSVTASAPAARTGPDRAADGLRVTQWRVIRAEWIKFRSLRSSVITLLSAVIVIAGLGLIFSMVFANGTSAGGPGGGPGGATDPMGASLGGVDLAQLIIGTLGVLLIAGEYSTGMIRSSLAAVPRRLPVLWGKAAVLIGVSLVVLVPTVLLTFVGGQAIIGSGHGALSLTDGGVLRSVLGSAVYLAGVGAFGMAVGALLRNTAGAITTVVAALLVVPGLMALLLPDRWYNDVARYLPSNAGGSFRSLAPGADMLSPWLGLAVFAGYLVVLFAAAAVRLRRRDA